MSKKYSAYILLVLATMFWSGNFIVGKFATLFEIPPLTLNVLRWISGAKKPETRVKRIEKTSSLAAQQKKVPQF